MKITFIVNPSDPEKLLLARAVALGCEKHGDSVEVVHVKRHVNDSIPIEAGGADAVCCWGWGRGQLQRQLGQNVLIMERPYLGDRSAWVSLGWNGLYRRAIFPCSEDGGARWRRYFAHLLHPWRINRDGYALLLGEVPLDSTERAIDFESWTNTTAQELERLGHVVRFRPHPKALAVRTPVRVIAGTLMEALADASFAVNWNSNAGVQAVLSGTPTVTMDRSAMAWNVTSHDLAFPIITPAREAWAHRLAYTQWLPEEIERGDAWAQLRDLV